ncbi:MAG: ligase-associated DNA damage response endonuclease PdeM [Alphaproteobacteria bacterium]|nr:ligase-associated DNA damage response endonuclease PdeM [Alphaproteobacteria bacterium]
MPAKPASVAAPARRPERLDSPLYLTGAEFAADPAGALYWPEHRLLAVSDLHLEKGSSFAARGILLPPYDTAATLARLSRLISRYAPRVMVALGDNFHDGGGPARLADTDRAALKGLQRGRDWVWIAGNHDPEPAAGIGGRFVAALPVGAVTFRHLPSPKATGEIAGHLHPVARVARRGRSVSRRCFAVDGSRVVMPAFGAYAGGLNVRDRAFAELFTTLAFTAHMLGERRVYAVAGRHCLPD